MNVIVFYVETHEYGNKLAEWIDFVLVNYPNITDEDALKFEDKDGEFDIQLLHYPAKYALNLGV